MNKYDKNLENLASSINWNKVSSLSELIDQIKKLRNCPLNLKPYKIKSKNMTGLTVHYQGVDYIYYSSDLNQFQKQHVILHELSHLILGHKKVEPFNEQRITIYSDPIECEAENLATLIALKISHQIQINDSVSYMVKSLLLF